jgi:hypothetical protein
LIAEIIDIMDMPSLSRPCLLLPKTKWRHYRTQPCSKGFPIQPVTSFQITWEIPFMQTQNLAGSPEERGIVLADFPHILNKCSTIWTNDGAWGCGKFGFVFVYVVS